MTQLEQEVFDYLDETPNAREATVGNLAARISYELDVKFSEAKEIVINWKINNHEHITTGKSKRID